MSGGPNNVTIVNNSGVVMLGGIVLHTFGFAVITGPAQFSTVLQTTNLPNGATAGPATTQTTDGLPADYWAGVFSFAGDGQYRIMAGDLDTEPYKKCDCPGNGSTQIVISPFNGDAYPVSINTLNSDGSSDGSCSSALLAIAQFADDPFAEGFEGLLHALLGDD